MKIVSISLIMLLGLMGCGSPAPDNNQMAQPPKNGKLFIIGGGSRGAEMVQRMIQESGLDSAGYGVILPMASIQPDSSIYYARRQFTDQGISSVVGMHFSDKQSIDPDRIDSLTNAQLIYISGGSQSRFMEAVRDTPIEKAIRTAYEMGAMIAGTSAGAAVMSRMMVTGDEKKHPEYESTFSSLEHENIIIDQGLGLLDPAIIIDQHFIQRSRYNRLITAVLEFPGKIGIGIEESTAILVENDQAEVVGQAQVIKILNPQHNQKVQKGLLGGENLILSVYLPGDNFKLK
ncbi:MAG: cyanophycinase [Candidatus Cyclobacteriaceae bacterium M3_2C_046]